MNLKSLTDKLFETETLLDEELIYLIETDENPAYLYKKADEKRKEIYSDKVYLRGLIEISSYCKNNCYYCGIRCENKNAKRYRLEKEEIMKACKKGFDAGFKTFVLQGGEDVFYTDDVLCDIVSGIRKTYPQCAITLSLGERSFESYEKLKNAGADRYLLRHETGDKAHYGNLHPQNMSFEKRIECLENLKKLKYQTGSGFMVGSPGQTSKTILKDLRLLEKLKPEMVGIGPFIPHCETPFAKEKTGDLNLTLKLISIIRLMLPHALIPSTTALATLSENGRVQGILCGANVVMPNISPEIAKEGYSLYDNKANTGKESIEGLIELMEEIRDAGYNPVHERGDVVFF
ncbi:MAG: [Clostridia bacterium]|nr:[FeFe] hydrogenase H-cluster radical SAM maturase HydE [Clostridia bacterium]